MRTVGLWQLGKEPVDLHGIGQGDTRRCRSSRRGGSGGDLLQLRDEGVRLVDDRLSLVEARVVHELLEASELMRLVHLVVGGFESLPDLLGLLLVEAN